MSYCLVVEDNHISGEVLDEHFKHLALKHIVCDHADKALEICMNEMPIVIILDWHMPEMDGVEFGHKLREMPNGDKPKIIICSCDSDGAKANYDISTLNVAGFLKKPTFLRDLQKMLMDLDLINKLQ